jgi:hypothetical protein
MPSKKNTEAPAAKIARNPSDKTARAMYDAVVAQEGTVGGVPARIALYGTKYAALEVGGEGAWEVDHDTAFGGVRAIEALRSGFDEVEAPAAVVEPESFGIVADEPKGAGGMASVPLTDFVAPSPAEDVVEGLAVLPAPVVAAEPTYATLDEVRAAHEAEVRGSCRASVLRALRVRAGEIALGVEKAPKAATATAGSGDKAKSLAALLLGWQAAEYASAGGFNVPLEAIKAAGLCASACKPPYWITPAARAARAEAGCYAGVRKNAGGFYLRIQPE